MQFTDTYGVIDVLEVSELNDLFVIFRIGAVVPRNFIDVPKMYLALWKKSNTDSLVIDRGYQAGQGSPSLLCAACEIGQSKERKDVMLKAFSDGTGEDKPTDPELVVTGDESWFFLYYPRARSGGLG
jgi:hypothetical protein